MSTTDNTNKCLQETFEFSPEDAKYMEMVVLPADLGEYGILNLGKTPCKVTKTMLK